MRKQLAANQLSRALFRTNAREQRVAPNPCGLSKIHDRNISTLSNACVPRSVPFRPTRIFTAFNPVRMKDVSPLDLPSKSLLCTLP